MRVLLVWIGGAALSVGQTLEPGDAIRVTLRGVAAEEQQKVNGEYTVGDDGKVSLPLLDHLVPASGLSPGGFARSLEKAYRNGGIYSAPAFDVVALKEVVAQGAVVSVGGFVKRAGQVPFRQGMTVIQALDAAGGRNEFASRNILLLRDRKQYVLDFRKLAHKNVELQAGDSLQVEQKPPLIDRWKGSDKAVAPLLGE